MEKAIDYFKLAADQGEAMAQCNLGGYYERGEGGLSQSYEKAVEYFKLAANQGLAKAQYKLGSYYKSGLGGLPQSDEKAIEYFNLSAKQGDAADQYSLGRICEEQGMIEEALQYYKSSAEQFDPKALGLFGIIGSTGQKINLQPYLDDPIPSKLESILKEKKQETCFLNMSHFSLDEAEVIRDAMINNHRLFFICPSDDMERLFLSYEFGGFERECLEYYSVINPDTDEEFYGFRFIGQRKIA